MDPAFIGRVLIALLIGGVLLAQSHKVTGQPHRKRAYELGAAALLCFAAYNLSVGAGAADNALAGAVAMVGMGLFVAAAVFLALSLRSGERNADHRRVVTATRSYVAEREQAQDERPAGEDEPRTPTDAPR